MEKIKIKKKNSKIPSCFPEIELFSVTLISIYEAGGFDPKYIISELRLFI